jgi:hypothetical protein
MPDCVLVLEKNFATWIQTASLREIRVVLHIIGRELLTERPLDIVQAGTLAWQARDVLDGKLILTAPQRAE